MTNTTELLNQARQLEQEFEAKKRELQDLQIKQEMWKQQFAQQKELLAAKGIQFTTGKELKEIFEQRQQRLQELIQNRQQAMVQLQQSQQTPTTIQQNVAQPQPTINSSNSLNTGLNSSFSPNPQDLLNTLSLDGL